MDGATLRASMPFLTAPGSNLGPDWQIVAVGDFPPAPGQPQDGHPELVFRNLGTGQNRIWYLNGTTKVGEASFCQ